MGPVLQNCRSRKSLELESKKTDMMSRFDKELNKLSDDEGNNESFSDDDDDQKDSGSEQEVNEEIGGELVDQRWISTQALNQQDKKEEAADEGDHGPLISSPAFVNYCDKWLELGKLNEKFEEVEIENEGEGGKQKMRVLQIDYFSLVFKSVFFWKKLKFEDLKEELYRQRRAILFTQGEPDMGAYRLILDQESSLEGQCMQEVVDAILTKIGLSEEEFTINVEYYKKDPVHYPKLKEITSITQEAMLELKMHYLGKEVKSKLVNVDQALTLYQLKVATQINLLKQIYELGEADRPATYDSAFQSIRPLLIDRIYQRTGGVEWEEVEDRVIKIAKEQMDAGNQ